MASFKEKIKLLITRSTKLIVFLSVFFILFFLASSFANAAEIYFYPNSGTYITGKNFTVSVVVNTDKALNAAEGTVNFPTANLEVIGISKTGSVFNLWTQEPSYSNYGNIGNVSFSGVVLNPGFVGNGGNIINIIFRVKSAGSANLNFTNASVLANDGLGTNILELASTASFDLQLSSTQYPQVTVPGSYPPRPTISHFVKNTDGQMALFNTSDQGLKWTNSAFANLTWLIPSGTTGIAYLFNDSSASNPGSKSQGLFDSKTFDSLTEGKHYFHIRFINALGAGPILHYPLFVDLTPPKTFAISFLNGAVHEGPYSTSNPSPNLAFTTTDDLSGIDHYEIKIDDNDWIKADSLFNQDSNSYVLQSQEPGIHNLIVRAFDKAGNYTDATAKLTIEPIVEPKITSYPSYLTSPGEKLVINGTASPKATVYITLKKDEPTILSTKADDNGKWELIYENILPSGTYSLTAKQILGNGAQSLETAPVYISVNSWLWIVWQWLKSIGASIFIVLLLLGIFIILIYYYLYRFKIMRVRLHKQIEEAKQDLARQSKKIKRDVEEGEPRMKVSKELEKMEKTIEEEIEDIDRDIKK